MQISSSSERLLAALFEEKTGQQLSFSRRWRIDTALRAIIRAHGFSGIDPLVSRIVTGKDEALALAVVEALLNNETFFFRDRLPFDLLFGDTLSRLERARARERRLSIWSAGCSTGQEPYSLAMAFAEQAARWQGWTIDIVGTDVSGAAINRARGGRYSQFEVQRGLPVVQMVRWFEEAGGGEWQIAPALRQMVRFEQLSLAEAPPRPRRFDIILCRNVLLYFAPDMRQRTFDSLASAIAPDGALMLGAGETVMGQTDRFRSDADNRGLYVPVAGTLQPPARRVA